MRATLSDPQVAADFARRGLTPWPTSEAAMGAQLAADAAKWQALIRAAGIQPS
jgi:tripartite-type tricarboxylate transporter receptor subunit TctC